MNVYHITSVFFSGGGLIWTNGNIDKHLLSYEFKITCNQALDHAIRLICLGGQHRQTSRARMTGPARRVIGHAPQPTKLFPQIYERTFHCRWKYIFERFPAFLVCS